MEWMEDYKEVEPHHRHVSHLYGLFPGSEITPHGTPELAEGANEDAHRSWLKQHQLVHGLEGELPRTTGRC